MVQALAELVEAAVRCHQPEVAQTALEALCAHTRLGGKDWGLGLEARSRRMRPPLAHAQLRTAYDPFEAIGTRSFAGRAWQELTATGATAHSRRNATLDELTAQEARIASLAGEGLSNPKIAARLYISKGTVDYHLNKVFRKLGIRSRAQLHRALALVPAHG
jgi:DNA-binding CsgD family transcriptional regulator